MYPNPSSDFEGIVWGGEVVVFNGVDSLSKQSFKNIGSVRMIILEYMNVQDIFRKIIN